MRILPLVISTFFTTLLFSQTQLEVSVIDGNITTTCTDIFFTPTPMWKVNIDQQGWEVYPRVRNCHNDVPNLQYTSADTYTCPQDVPESIEVCIQAFENDGLFGCSVVEDCVVDYCETIPIIPAKGKWNHTLNFPAGGESEGFVEIEIAVSGDFVNSGNDHICGAFDLGVLDYDMTLGDASTDVYENICAEEGGEPHPKSFDSDAWHLHNGVWFTFTTGPNPSSALFVNQISDPTGLGDGLGLQAAVFTTDDDSCQGNLDLIAFDWEFESDNDTVFFYCPEPNQTYYILVDGIWLPDLRLGYFGLDVYDPGVRDRGDLICDNVELGAIPAGGNVSSGKMSNFCVGNVGDPRIRSFIAHKTVWASFVAPATGHVNVRAISQAIPDPIDLEIAVFESSDGTCGGALSERGSISPFNSRNAELELSCLTPGETYYVMIDGSSRDLEGIFELIIEELPDDTPITNLDETVCANETFQVWNSVYNQSGNYVDTILLGGGCDSVVYTKLTVLDSVKLAIVQIDRAIGLGTFTGSANVLATGGSGDFIYRWSDGQTNSTAINLEGGTDYCVTVTDIQGGCDFEACIFVEYITPIIPSFNSNDVICNGESNGSISFSVNNGEPPYDFEWMGSGLNGSGNIDADNETIFINNLPSADYEITVRDIYFDTTFVVTVVQPDEVRIFVDEKIDASCFGVCDGSFEVHGEGGVGNYQFGWPSAGSQLANGVSLLCAATYPIQMQDSNGCQTQISIEINQPAEFIADGIEDKGVTCLGWSDGVGSISTNGRPTDFEWENGGLGQTVLDLAAGDYRVTVTNQDGCKDTTIVTITEPANPYLVNISVEEPIQCKGDSNGRLMANTTGGNTVDYNWSTGKRTAEITDLSTGFYKIIAISETGCEAIDSIEFAQPDELYAEPVGNKLTCLDPDDGGAVEVLTTTGGEGPYQYSVDGVNFTDATFIDGLFTGVYDLIVKDKLGCEREFPFEVSPPDPIDVTLPDDMIIELGDDISLQALTNNSNAVFEWSEPDLDCIDSNCSEVDFLPLNPLTIQITATDTTSSCFDTDEININVLKTYKVFIPNAFSPNNDGINDKLNIFGANSVANIKQFKVFDRYGSLMFAEKDFLPNDEAFGWDGTWKGQLLSTGVYVFFAEVEFIDGEVEIFEGDVTIAR